MKKIRKRAFWILGIAELAFAIVLTTLWISEAKQKTEEVQGTWDFQSFLYEEGVPMTQFPYSELSGLYVDNSLMEEGQEEIVIQTPKVTLRPGWYQVVVTYSLSDAGNSFGCVGGGWETADREQIQLPAGADQTETVTLHLLTEKNIGTEIRYEGDGYLYLNSVTVTKIPGIPTDLLACGILGFVALNLLVLVWCRLDGRARRYLIALLAVSLLSSAPLFLPHLYSGDDLDFHLLRIDALAAGLRNGQFPVRVSTFWNNGWGYGTSLYYCDLFLLLPALLRLAGLCAQRAYIFYGLFINLLTAALCWYAFRRMFRSRKTALAGTIVYVLLPYRLLCLYRRAAVGEYTAMAFFPLLAVGLYLIYTAVPPRKERPLRERAATELRVIAPALTGYCGVIASHVISSLFAGFFTLLVCLLLIRRTCTRTVLARLFGTLLLVFCLSAWFVVPFADSMRNPIQVTSQEGAEKMGEYGVHLIQLADLFPDVSGGNIAVSEETMAKAAGQKDITYSAGISLYGAAAFVLYAAIRRRGKKNLFGYLCAGLGFLSALMSSLWFPWWTIASLGGFGAALVSDIQFPWRFLGPAGILFTMASMSLLEALQEEKKLCAGQITWWCMVLLSVVSALCVLCSSHRNGQIWDYSAEPPVETTNLGGGEYLPEGADPSLFAAFDPVPGADVEITEFQKQDGTIELTLANNSDAESCVDLPLLYYPGYIGIDTATGEKFVTGYGESARVRIFFPAGYEGTIRIRYQERKLWRLAELLTLVTVLFLEWVAAGEKHKTKDFVR